MCLANIKSCLQGKHLGSLFDDKHTNGLFNGECRKTTSETKLHNFLTQFRETANTERGRTLIWVPSSNLCSPGVHKRSSKTLYSQAQIRLPGFRGGEEANCNAEKVCSVPLICKGIELG